MVQYICNEKTVDSVHGSLRQPEAACNRLNHGRLRTAETVANCESLWQTVGNVADCGKCGRLWEMWQTVGNVADCGKCGRLWEMWQTVGNVAVPLVSLCSTCQREKFRP
jgi:hypothetical protein